MSLQHPIPPWWMRAYPDFSMEFDNIYIRTCVKVHDIIHNWGCSIYNIMLYLTYLIWGLYNSLKMLAHLGMIPLANHHSRLVKNNFRTEAASRASAVFLWPGPEKKWFGRVMSSWNRHSYNKTAKKNTKIRAKHGKHHLCVVHLWKVKPNLS